MAAPWPGPGPASPASRVSVGPGKARERGAAAGTQAGRAAGREATVTGCQSGESRPRQAAEPGPPGTGSHRGATVMVTSIRVLPPLPLLALAPRAPPPRR